MRTPKSKRRYKTGWRENARIVWAITAKDLLEAVKNKNTIMVLLTSLFMVFFYRIMPVIFDAKEPVNVLAYDAGNSKLVAYLENDQNVKLYTYPSEERMKQVLANGEVPELGLVIPADFDQSMASGEPLNLQGYRMYWVNQEDATQLKRAVESEISRLVGSPVAIQTEGNIVYHSPDSDGLGVQAGIATVFILVMVGLSLVGHLFLEEKQSRTIESVLVSPASAGHVVLAKALTGLFYCLLGGGVALAVNHDLIVHWGLAIAAVLATSLFTVSLGLLMGSRIENRGQLTLWAIVILVPMLIPIFLALLDDLVPETVIQISRLIPTVTAFNLLRISFANPIPFGTALFQWVWILAWGMVILAGTAWLVHRQEAGTGQAWLWGRTSQIWHKKLELAVRDGLRQFTPVTEAFPRAGQVQEKAVPLPEESKRPWLEALPQEDMQLRERPKWQGLRILLAIAGKDIREALQNKIFISLILGVGVMIASNAVLPLLINRQNLPTVIVYDEGRSTIIRGLTGSDEFQIGLVDSRQALQEALSEAPATRMGLVIPADFDQNAGSSQVIQLEGLSAHWADQDKINQWKLFFEEQLGAAAWAQVNINLSDQSLYPGLESGGNPLMVIVLSVIVMFTMGAALVPLLLIEEKENHTIEALLVSPATFTQLISGKALAGSTFCLLAGLVVILFNRYLFVNWWVVFLAVVFSTAFAVAIGLVIGTISGNPAMGGMLGGLILLSLIFLTVLQFLGLESLPPLLQTLLSWFPGSYLVNLFRFSMAKTFPFERFLTILATLGAELGALCILVSLLVRRGYQ
jgi:ABC-type Na+ efflux pump permease subunit